VVFCAAETRVVVKARFHVVARIVKQPVNGSQTLAVISEFLSGARFS
jgi:hypothetical protein